MLPVVNKYTGVVARWDIIFTMASKFWSRFWGKKENVSTEDAIQKLRDLEEMLNKKSEYLEQKIQEETERAKNAGFKNKRGRWMFYF